MSDASALLVCAVEASADLHGAAVLRELKALRPGLRAFGAAGPLMRAEGCEALVRAEDLSVMGITEVIPALPRIFAALGKLRRAAAERRPRAALLIDSPDFNLRLARRLRESGVRVAYFIGPSVWAWRTGRVRQIARDVLRMLVILPFEPAFYAQHGVRAVYVGNPLVDETAASGFRLQASGTATTALSATDSNRDAVSLAALPEARSPKPEAALGSLPEARSPKPEAALALLRTSLGLDPSRPVLALLPGSRRQEIRRIFPALLGAARLLRAERPGLQLAVPVAPTLPRALLQDAADAASVPVTLVAGRAPDVLACADAAAVASGTAALEAALAQVPSVIVYRTSWLTWLVARLLVRVRFVGLPNLIADRAILPELLQGACTPERIAAVVAPLLDGGPARTAQLDGLAAVRAALVPPGAQSAARRAAEEVLAMLEGAS